MSEPLTDRQRETLDILIEAALHGEPPTLREIGDAMGIRSTNGVTDHLRALERKGYIDRDGTKSRRVRVLGLWPRPPMTITSEPARVYTFEDWHARRDWWDELGHEFEARIIGAGDEKFSLVVTRVKS